MSHPMRKKRFIAILLLTMAVLAFAGTSYANTDHVQETPSMRARVLAVEERLGEELFFAVQRVTLEITTGPHRDLVVEVENHLSDNPVYDVPVKPGDRVLVIKEVLPDGGMEFHIVDYVRDTWLLVMVAAFVFLLLLIGRMKGLKTILTLSLTLVMIVRVLLPGLLKGYPPVLLTLAVSVFITLVSILLINGPNVKSFSAIIGILGGLFTAGIVVFLIGGQIRLTGLSSEEAVMLMFIPQEVAFDFRDLLFAGIMMGALGAVMDVGMSIASAMYEIRHLNPEVTYRQLVRSGMNVGRDIMTTMSNTLILAYTGAAMPLLLLFMAYDASLVEIINMDMIATEIVRALSGSIGLVMTIPLTVVASAFLLVHTSGEKQH